MEKIKDRSEIEEQYKWDLTKIYKTEEEFRKDISKGLSLKAIGNEVGMSKQRVHYILKNQMYRGKFIYDGEVEHNNISYNVDRIVSDYIFNKVNK